MLTEIKGFNRTFVEVLFSNHNISKCLKPRPLQNGYGMMRKKEMDITAFISVVAPLTKFNFINLLCLQAPSNHKRPKSFISIGGKSSNFKDYILQSLGFFGSHH